MIYSFVLFVGWVDVMVLSKFKSVVLVSIGKFFIVVGVG